MKNGFVIRPQDSQQPVTAKHGEGGSTLNRQLPQGYFAMQTFFASVKKRSASSPPSRPTPLAFMPPKGTRKSRTSQQFTHTVPVLIFSATRCARLRFCVQTLEERPYSTSLAQLITSSSLSNGVIVT